MQIEEWRIIRDNENESEVSSFDDMRSIDSQRILKNQINTYT
jgi:hypothetical protein